MPPQRQTAYPCTVGEILRGELIAGEPGSSGIATPRGTLGRVSVLGVIVEQDSRGATLEDGTGRIVVRAFDPVPTDNPGPGAIVLVIGRPREYNGERYIAREICARLRNPGWIKYRQRELALLAENPVGLNTPAAASVPAQNSMHADNQVHEEQIVRVPEGKNPFERIVEAIRKLDDGKGADIDAVLATIDHPEKDRLIRVLLEEGEIFELRPGILKVLE